MHWIIIGMTPTYYSTSNCFEPCDAQRFHCQNVCAIDGPVLYPYKNEEICVASECFCVNITICITLHYFSMCFTSAWVKCMSQWHLAMDCSVRRVGQQVWSTFNSGSDTHFDMRIYGVIKIISYTKIACCYYNKDT